MSELEVEERKVGDLVRGLSRRSVCCGEGPLEKDV